MRIDDVVQTLERFAPLPLQDDFDNAGLQVGIPGSNVSGALLCLDVTEVVVREAVARGCNLVVSHHPVLFHALKRVTEATQPERVVRLAVKHDVAIYSAHTNLDNCRGGVNFKIAGLLGLEELEFLVPFVRNGHAGGSGVIGTLPVAEEMEAFLARVKQTFGAGCLMHNVPLRRPLRRVALCGGAGASLLSAALVQGADCFLTGEMSYHHFFGLEDRLLTVALGHYESEQFTVDLLHDTLKAALPDLRMERCSTTNPVQYD